MGAPRSGLIKDDENNGKDEKVDTRRPGCSSVFRSMEDDELTVALVQVDRIHGWLIREQEYFQPAVGFPITFLPTLDLQIVLDRNPATMLNIIYFPDRKGDEGTWKQVTTAQFNQASKDASRILNERYKGSLNDAQRAELYAKAGKSVISFITKDLTHLFGLSAAHQIFPTPENSSKNPLFNSPEYVVSPALKEMKEKEKKQQLQEAALERKIPDEWICKLSNSDEMMKNPVVWTGSLPIRMQDGKLVALTNGKSIPLNIYDEESIINYIKSNWNKSAIRDPLNDELTIDVKKVNKAMKQKLGDQWYGLDVEKLRGPLREQKLWVTTANTEQLKKDINQFEHKLKKSQSLPSGFGHFRSQPASTDDTALHPPFSKGRPQKP